MTVVNNSTMEFGINPDTGDLSFAVKTPMGDVTFELDREFAFDMACCILDRHSRLPRAEHERRNTYDFGVVLGRHLHDT